MVNEASSEYTEIRLSPADTRSPFRFRQVGLRRCVSWGPRQKAGRFSQIPLLNKLSVIPSEVEESLKTRPEMSPDLGVKLRLGRRRPSTCQKKAFCEICGYKSGMKIRSLLILLLSIWIGPLILAQQTPQSLADAELPSLLGIYKDIHSHPELSGHEERTAALVAKELKAAGCEVT